MARTDLWWVAWLVVAGVIAIAYLRSARAQRRRAERRLREQRRELRERRELRLEDAGIAAFELDELSALVEDTTRKASIEASYFKLDELLDLYVEVAIAERAYLQLSRAPLKPVESAAEPRRAVREAALRLHQQNAEGATMCRDLLGAVSEFVRLYAERASMPDAPAQLTDEVLAGPLALIDADIERREQS